MTSGSRRGGRYGVSSNSEVWQDMFLEGFIDNYIIYTEY
jgi:hypothetical protein